MPTPERYFWGIDCGSSAIKVALCDDAGDVLQLAKGKTLFPLLDHVVRTVADPAFPTHPVADPGEPPESWRSRPGHVVTTTGYGRHKVPFADKRITEIKAHLLGSARHAPGPTYTLIDIGGQDSKVVHVVDSRLERFAFNRKCAAGTGAFIEELAHRLEIPLGELTERARQHDKEISLGSYCTVFAVQEVIRILMSGERVENLIQALYRSVVKRVLEMAPIETDAVIFSGGVIEHHPILVDLFAERLPHQALSVSPHAQFCGAIGAARHGVLRAAAGADAPPLPATEAAAPGA